MGDVAVALIRPQMRQICTQRAAPIDRLALVAVMTKPNRIADIRHQVADHLSIATKAVAGKDQLSASDGFDRAIGATRAQTGHTATVRKQAFHTPHKASNKLI